MKTISFAYNEDTLNTEIILLEDFDINNAMKFSNLIFKNVRKKINNNINIKNTSRLLEKRVNQLTIDDLLNIYNFF